MATKVQIHITGLALCYLAGNDWKIDFLCDDNHQLFFTQDGDSSSSISLGKNKKIEILAVKENPKSGTGHKFEEIFNMVTDAHPDGVDLVEPTPPRRKVSMTIQSAYLYSEKPTNKIYGIKKANTSDPYRPLRKVAEIVGAEIKLKTGEYIILRIDGNIHPLPVNDRGILSFDNDCRPLSSPVCRSDNDSLLYYELVKGRENPSVRYIFTRIEEVRIKGVESKKLLSHPDGNCDPVVVNPPPPIPPE